MGEGGTYNNLTRVKDFIVESMQITKQYRKEDVCPICLKGDKPVAHECENCGKIVCQDCFNSEMQICQDCEES